MSLSRFDGPFNMAQDAALLERAERGALGWRVYGWDGPWVSLGHYQSPDRDLLDPASIPWVMRPTGGKAVLHGHDVTVGLAAPLRELATWGNLGREADLNRSLRTVYRLAIRPILEAMRACGVPAVLGEEVKPSGKIDKTMRERGIEGIENAHPLPPPPLSPSSRHGEGRSADCFAAVSPNDVVDARSGFKVCGCALKLSQSAVLVQASLPAGDPLIDPRRVFARPAPMSAPRWDPERFPQAFEAAMQRVSQVRTNV